MFFKTLVVIIFIFIVWSLFSGLYFLNKDKGQSNRTVKSLTWRIGLSISLFILLMIGAYFGWITPHGVV